jgi:hypothetical protein
LVGNFVRHAEGQTRVIHVPGIHRTDWLPPARRFPCCGAWVDELTSSRLRR